MIVCEQQLNLWQNALSIFSGGLGMEAYWTWWLATVVLVIAEISTGTFYLLAVAFGFAAAGLAAYLGVAWNGQAVIAAVLCSVSVAVIHRWNKQRVKTEEQANFSNDIGQAVRAVSWSDDRHARVSYRGAEWDAELADNVASDISRQTWQITKIVGSHLVIE
jgi:membrane protein implicated in regulation of membrane protease activity